MSTDAISWRARTHTHTPHYISYADNDKSRCNVLCDVSASKCLWEVESSEPGSMVFCGSPDLRVMWEPARKTPVMVSIIIVFLFILFCFLFFFFLLSLLLSCIDSQQPEPDLCVYAADKICTCGGPADCTTTMRLPRRANGCGHFCT